MQTADVPFFYFLGKAKFSFFSNSSAVLGATGAPVMRKDSKNGEKLSPRFEEFSAGDLFNFNYNTRTGSAAQPEITVTQLGPASIKCQDCYFHAGIFVDDSGVHVPT